MIRPEHSHIHAARLRSKIDPARVLELRSSGETLQQIGERFGVTAFTIKTIINRTAKRLSQIPE